MLSVASREGNKADCETPKDAASARAANQASRELGLFNNAKSVNSANESAPVGRRGRLGSALSKLSNAGACQIMPGCEEIKVSVLKGSADKVGKDVVIAAHIAIR